VTKKYWIGDILKILNYITTYGTNGERTI